MKIVPSSKVNIRPETSLVVDQIEMPPQRAPDFDDDNLLRRAIEFFQREGLHEFVDIGLFQIENKIKIIGQSGFSVDDTGRSASNHVRALDRV